MLRIEERRSRGTEIVLRLYEEGWARGDFDVVFDLLDPKIVWTAIEGAPDAGTYCGHGGGASRTAARTSR